MMKTMCTLMAGLVILGVAVMTWAEDDATTNPAQVEAEQPIPPVNVVVPPDPDALPFLEEKHFVMNWLLLGPFMYDKDAFAGDEQQAAATHAFVNNEGELDGSQEAPEGTTWQVHSFTGDVQAGQVNLHVPYGGNTDYAAAYAVAILRVDEPMESLSMWVGSDDYLQIWLNGQLIHTYDQKRRGSDWDQDLIEDVTLNQGDNRLVVKCVDVVGGWDFYLRLTDVDDNPLTIEHAE